MEKFFANHKRLLRGLGIIIALLLIAVYIGMPTVMAIGVIMPEPSHEREMPDGFSEIDLLTEDNVRLAAWYAEPQNGAVIILVHGAGSGCGSVKSYATMLRENGFGVLAVNMRGYGESEGHINRLGWNGTHDIGAAIDYLMARDEVDFIGGLGLSMGGEILLGAAAEYPALQAIVADGATFRSINEYTALPMNRSLYRNFTMRVFSFMVGLFSGDDQPEPLIESITAAETTSYLFIAAGKDAAEIAFNELFHQTVREHSSLWVIPDVAHTGGFAHDPADYERRVIDFFTTTFDQP